MKAFIFIGATFVSFNCDVSLAVIPNEHLCGFINFNKYAEVL